jgi:hypothetical protein
MNAHLSDELTDSALRLAGVYPQEWLCPVCGEVLQDEQLQVKRPPRHVHRNRVIELIPRAQL